VRCSSWSNQKFVHKQRSRTPVSISRFVTALCTLACISPSYPSPLTAQAGGVCSCILGNNIPQACGSVPAQCTISPAGNAIWFVPSAQVNGNCSSPPCAPKKCSATISVVITGTSSCRYKVRVDDVESGAGVPTEGQPFSVSHGIDLECGQQAIFEVQLAGVCQYKQTYTCHACTH